MTYLAYMLALLCALLHIASAAPPPALRSTGRPLPIDGFVAQGYPDVMDGTNHLSFVEYNVTLSPGEDSIWCWAWSEVSDLSIGDVPTTACQADHTVKWSFMKAADAYNFTVSWQYTGHGHLIGSWMIPDSQVQWITDAGDVAVQHYVGPTSFSVDTDDVFGT
ncbi:hypothetical protein CONLIGDRAFT_681561 [Coniochaeta ligniaria NRRL 30616]|uniref:Uncharacterized protein n=1 Tax=Coniochaeta ligniaria NRRL 30616 TaxID=1408157 RepID=A0A1J7IMK9_9PEZI|nr:hypothetical protein CONLIGDRAFT_681561 [Coniochaeta ligniaria NRRL 30616]